MSSKWDKGLWSFAPKPPFWCYFLSSDRPKPPQGRVEFLELSGNCVHMKWKAPKDNGGRPVTQFIVERRAVGKKAWIKIGEVDSKVTNFSTNKVEEGKAYQFRILAVNSEGVSDPLETDEVFAGNPIGQWDSPVFNGESWGQGVGLQPGRNTCLWATTWGSLL